MTVTDIAAIWVCLFSGLLTSLRAELGRQRLVGYPDLSLSVRISLHLLSVLFFARAWRIFTGFGSADVSEVVLYVGGLAVVLLQVVAMVRAVWCGKLARVKADAIPEIKEAVQEAIPPYLRVLHQSPPGYENAGGERGVAMTPLDRKA